MPLAVVGSNVVVEVNGKKVRGRQYPWGVAEGKFRKVQLSFLVKQINKKINVDSLNVHEEYFFFLSQH